MYWIFIIAAAGVVAVLFLIGFITPSDIKGGKSWKQWLQAAGAGIMFSSIYHRGFRFDEKLFAIGALIFASTFLTWKRSEKGDKSDGLDDRDLQ